MRTTRQKQLAKIKESVDEAFSEANTADCSPLTEAIVVTLDRIARYLRDEAVR